jgi:phosphatidylglycerophosphatase A
VYLLLRALFLTWLWPTGQNATLDLTRLGYSMVALELIAIVCIALVGIWAGTRTEKLVGKKDPGKVVIDEVAGQMLALVAVPLGFSTWWTIALAFVLFRLFDIVKPYPARRLESLKSGLGIMADDIVAGAYAAVAVTVVVTISYLI